MRCIVKRIGANRMLMVEYPGFGDGSRRLFFANIFFGLIFRCIVYDDT